MIPVGVENEPRVRSDLRSAAINEQFDQS
jgi:hypothetical protein